MRSDAYEHQLSSHPAGASVPMNLGGRVSLSVGAVLVLAVAGWLAMTCARRDGIAVGKQLEHDASVDRVNVAQAAAQRDAAAAWQHHRDSIDRAGQVLRSRAAAATMRADSAEQRLREMPGLK